jgi:hypothetical protein
MAKTGVWSFAAALLVLAACSSSGSGGSGGQNCADICPGVLSAHCSQGPANESDCESGCATLRASACASQYNALLSCGGSQPHFTCDASGNVTVAGCEQQGQTLYACLSGSGGSGGTGAGGSGGSGGSGAFDCANACPKVVAAQCSNGPGTVADCETGCSSMGSGSCSAQYNAVVACVTAQGAGYQISCDANGEPIVAGCETQYAQLYSCLGF